MQNNNNTRQNDSGPTRQQPQFALVSNTPNSITPTMSKDSTLKYINIADHISRKLFQHSKHCEHCAEELRKSLNGVEKEV